MVHQQVLVPIVKTGHLIKLAGICYEKASLKLERFTCCTKTLHFIDESFKPYSFESFRYIKKNSLCIFSFTAI